MSVFLLIWVISLLSFIVSIKFKNIGLYLSWIAASVSFFLAAFRSDIYPDYKEYLSIFENIRETNLLSKDFLGIHGEIGFKFLVKLINAIFPFDVLIFVLFSASSLWLIYSMCKKYNFHISGVWLVYYSSSFLLKDLAQIRNALASLLVVYSALEFSSGNYKKGYIYTFIASAFFQYLSAVALITRVKINSIYILPLICAGVVLGFTIDFDLLVAFFGLHGYFLQFYELDYVNPEAYNVYPALVRSMILIIFFWPYIRFDGQGKITKLWFMLLYSFVSYIACANVPILSQRLGGYFLAADAFIFSALVYKNKNFVTIGVLIFYSSLVFFYNLTSRAHLVYEYKWMF